jgi:hypothetical protein
VCLLTNILYSVWKLVEVNVYRSFIIISALYFQFPLTFFKVLMTILIVNTLFEILQDTLTLKKWVKTSVITSLLIGLIYGTYRLAGFFGIVGIAIASVVVLLSMLVFILYNNWKLYDAVTTWGAERVRGKHKREFDLKEAMKK